jgi:hypothetical protein
MAYSVYPALSSGITVSDGNNAGWNLGETQWEQISEYKNATTVANIDFSSIPQTYRGLKLQIVGLTLSTADQVYLRINNDSTVSTYSRFGRAERSNNSGTITVIQQHSQNKIQLNGDQNVESGNTFHCFIHFPNYTSSNVKKLEWNSYYQTAVGAETFSAEGTFRKGTTTPAITSLRLLTNSTNMYFDGNEALSASLWGIK